MVLNGELRQVENHLLVAVDLSAHDIAALVDSAKAVEALKDISKDISYNVKALLQLKTTTP